MPGYRTDLLVLTCPVAFQVTMCDQLTHYLNKFVAAAAPAATTGPAAGGVATIDGYKVLCHSRAGYSPCMFLCNLCKYADEGEYKTDQKLQGRQR